MGLTKLKVKARCPPSRGQIDAIAVMSALKDYWGELQSAIESLPAEE